MFDIGFSELVLVAVIGLLVLGPERLPGAIRTGSLWLGRLRRSFNNIRAEIEREINADEIRQDLHNEGVMESLKQAEQDLRGGLEAADESASIGTLANDESTISDTDKP
jgi:sec-independent protein translocase protein TatB